MANISAQMVKELRDMTGAGMMDCKAALGETSGDVQAAVDWLRTKGLAAAAKKAGRQAAEGLVGVSVAGAKGAVVEVNSETDFVAKNEQFQGFVRDVAQLVLSTGSDIDALNNAAYPSGGTVAEALTNNIATIGENQSLRRAAVLEVGQGVVVSYVHNAAAPNMGKIGVLVGLESAAPADALTALQVGYSGPDVADPRALVQQVLDAGTHHRAPENAPQRALRVLENAAHVDAIIAVSSGLMPIGTQTSSEAQLASDAIRPLAGVVRSARRAAVDAVESPRRLMSRYTSGSTGATRSSAAATYESRISGSLSPSSRDSHATRGPMRSANCVSRVVLP